MSFSKTLEETAAAVARLLPALQAIFGERAVTSAAVRAHHSHGEGLPDPGQPDAVLFPLSTEEVAAAMKLCHEAEVPVIAFGTGTSMEGHVAAIHGGVCIDLSRMDRILAVSPEALDCRVQAGVTREQLNAHLRSSGLFFAVDPGANASLGGMAATRASGTAAVRYGTMREAVMGLTVVTPDGRIIRTGTRARKSASGLDLTRLYVGSEGLLGIICEVQLRLFGLPEHVVAAVCQFDSLRAAVDTVIAALQLAVPVARIELLDDAQMDACIRYSRLEEFEARPTLFIEFHGSEAAVAEQVATLEALSADHGGSGFRYAHQPEERTRLWKARHSCYHANLAMHPGWSSMGTDACVPISALAECIMETQADIAASGLYAPIVGHVGDGNFHLGIIYDDADPAARAAAEALAERVALRAIRLGGTCTGEHGVGLHRMQQIEVEHGPAIEVMREIKRALDPKGILNPGKMLRMDRAAASDVPRGG
ncbi:MAG: FAD-linked oxidase C-terminal domain-containing protein [Pseudomonadota bacterium]|nr:FAD-linked oxidase C-terminal domain-containing protein [Pseudomonadota bacterium]MDQ8000227.1 FAD-linked oxidase C-terminal domain-containing protein [Pseudomonadota bacterium]MDQ8015643.1 FAD-linked oxidase C-terminal domain-containing protein [Pseudomonadota bacterium]